MERSLSTRDPREIRGCGAADHRESSVKKRHVIRRVIKMTPDINTLCRFHEKEATIRSGVPQVLWRVNLISISIERDGR